MERLHQLFDEAAENDRLGYRKLIQILNELNDDQEFIKRNI